MGELLDGGRYHVHANLGKGMFSTVVRARDTNWKESNGVEGQSEVAIKVIRSQESMSVSQSYWCTRTEAELGLGIKQLKKKCSF